ncbi:MAG UNVERIFIED_CONTAM: hypothetical protein LVT10_00975 [Anaerolineae bacterium]
MVIASLIGFDGLGEVVLKALRRLRVGQAFEAGLAIVCLAILMDRVSYAFSRIEHRSIQTLPSQSPAPRKILAVAMLPRTRLCTGAVAGVVVVRSGWRWALR